MLTKIDEPGVAGINGVKGDAVELSSQFMGNYYWQRDSLKLFAKHYKTGENLPDKLFNKTSRSKKRLKWNKNT
jgi:oligopeptidase A